MQLTGIHKDTRTKHFIMEYEYPRLEFTPGTLLCQYCESPLTIVHGSKKHKHLRHMVKECPVVVEKDPESPEHLAGKSWLVNMLPTHFPELVSCTFELEYPFKLGGKVIREADVVARFPMGWILVHEVQISPITYDKLQERTDDYRLQGADVWWWLDNRWAERDSRLLNYCTKQNITFFLLNIEEQSRTFDIK